MERIIEFFNLDAIVSVSYRVNSKQGTRFRIWATKRLKNYLVKGFAVNEKRVKEYQGNLVKFFIKKNKIIPTQEDAFCSYCNKEISANCDMKNSNFCKQ